MLFYLRKQSLVYLLSVRASLSQAGLTAGRLAQMNIAVSAHDNCLRMTKNSGNLEASGTLDIHEKGVGRLHKSLQLVCASLNFRSRV